MGRKVQEGAQMTKAPKRPRDPNQLAKLIVDIATGDAEDAPAPDSAAVEAGREGGKKRAANLSPERRSELAQKAAQARWSRS